MIGWGRRRGGGKQEQSEHEQGARRSRGSRSVRVGVREAEVSGVVMIGHVVCGRGGVMVMRVIVVVVMAGVVVLARC